jgi:myo-inositol 2-dehydrogenase / D-chiro-inositol 1-dehydrogenase
MENSNALGRRDFLAGLGAATVGLTMATHNVLYAQEAKKIRLGIIGCGGRGDWIADLFIKHGGYELAALADYFEDRVNPVGEKYQVPASRRFTTLSGYKKVLDCNDVDAVVIVSPPYFHPEHARAAVKAGKHVYLAKPIAVDVPGCKIVEECGRKATEKKKCFLVDFQTRANEHFIEAVRRVHNGAIGEFVFGEAYYQCDRLETTIPDGGAEARLRNWVFDKALSGDIIVEQNIHSLDVMSWVMAQPPLHATGTGGRKVRTDVGDCWDYFTLLIEYPNQVGVTFSSRQFNAQGTKPDGIYDRVFGTRGVLETEYGGQVLLRSSEFYKGRTDQIFLDGVINNIAQFHKIITEGNYENPTVAPSVQSNLIGIMARTAAYQNRRVTWNEILRNTDVNNPGLGELKS